LVALEARRALSARGLPADKVADPLLDLLRRQSGPSGLFHGYSTSENSVRKRPSENASLNPKNDAEPRA
jgi:hypothetical protein